MAGGLVQRLPVALCALFGALCSVLCAPPTPADPLQTHPPQNRFALQWASSWRPRRARRSPCRAEVGAVLLPPPQCACRPSSGGSSSLWKAGRCPRLVCTAPPGAAQRRLTRRPGPGLCPFQLRRRALRRARTASPVLLPLRVPCCPPGPAFWVCIFLPVPSPVLLITQHASYLCDDSCQSVPRPLLTCGL